MLTKNDYEYHENLDNIWDYYSIEYELNSIIYYFDYLILPNGVYTNYTLTDVKRTKIKGTWTHEKNIYYLRESALGITCDLLLNTKTNQTAFKISGNPIMQLLREKNISNKWITIEELPQSKQTIILRNLNHFYDKEILNLFQNESFYTVKDNIYTFNEDNLDLVKNSIKKWFSIDEQYPKFSSIVDIEVTSVTAQLDLSKEQKPKVGFTIDIYFPQIDKSFSCGGKIIYNNIYNTVVNLPKEVTSQWDAN